MTRVVLSMRVDGSARSEPSFVDEAPRSGAERIDADLLIPGRGEPIKNASLVFEGAKITYAGSSKELPSRFKLMQASRKIPVLMPGMWDCHAHLIGFSTFDLTEVALMSQVLAGARLSRDVASLLSAGFTSVRDPGGYGAELTKAIMDEWIPGPNIYSACAIISQTGGHGDLHNLPLSLVKEGIDIKGLPFALCDGADECMKAVRAQVRKGAKFIKICSTGGVLSIIDKPTNPEFSDAELKAIVEEATRTDIIVSAHAHGTQGIINALKAGVHTIEHGSYLNEEAISLFLEKDAILVATRSIVVYGVANIDQIPPTSQLKMKETNEAHKKSYAMAVKAGVRCALGTDMGVSSNKVKFNHGMNGSEFFYATEAGMSPLEAIEAGTANGPLTLGPQAPMSGQLKEGYDADFIGLSENPLDDIIVLANPKKVEYVWKGGKLYKAPGKPVGFIS